MALSKLSQASSAMLDMHDMLFHERCRSRAVGMISVVSQRDSLYLVLTKASRLAVWSCPG